MKEHKKLSLHEEINREAEEIEKKIEEREDLDDLKVSENMEASLFNKIQEYEFNNRTRIVHRKKKKKYVVLALAAVLVLVFGSMMTSVGSKSYWKVLWDRMAGEEEVSYIDVDKMNSQDTEDINEIHVYKEIRNELGISTVRMAYMPKEMYLKEYELDLEQKSAVLIYDYNGSTVKFLMYMNDSDSSFAQTEIDQFLNQYKIIIDSGITVNIEEFEVKNKSNRRCVAEFEYRDTQYQVMGIMDNEIFKKIVENLYFLE